MAGMVPFAWDDPFALDAQLSEDERMIRDAAHAFAQGELQPRVREAFAKMDLLRFEHLKDSVEEAAPQPPEELVKLLMEFLDTNAKSPQKPSLGA